jgi:pimeloyl-ACP methyl ester carboxylesterase
MTSGFLPLDGAELYYEVEGSGIPLVLIHAGVADLRMWDAQIAAFAPRFRIIRYDTRFFGKTRITDPNATYSNRRDLAALLDHLGVEKAVIAGCSRGGQIAVDFTLEFPERAAGLTPICAALSGFDYEAVDLSDEDAVMGEMESLIATQDWETIADRSAQLWVTGPHRPADERPPQPVWDYVRAVSLDLMQRGDPTGTVITLDPPAAGRLGEIRVPTLVIIGNYDTIATRAVADALSTGIAGARKVVIEGTAHLPNMEKPEEFNRLVLEFAEQV